MKGVPIEALQRLPLFADLSKREVERIAKLFKERRFGKGETVVQEGSAGAAFFVIESGEATVSIGGKERSKLKAGDYFGEGARPKLDCCIRARTRVRLLAIDTQVAEALSAVRPDAAMLLKQGKSGTAAGRSV